MNAHLNPTAGLAFAVEVCQRVSGPDDVWLPTPAQADALAAEVWPPISAKMSGCNPNTVLLRR